MLGEPTSGERHADAVAAALPERTGRRLNPRGQMIFGMAGAFAAELAKPLDVVERDRGFVKTLIPGVDSFDASEMEQGIEQHRGMAIRQHEAVAIWPDWIVGIEAQELLPDGVDQRRQRHRRARVPRFRLLHGVHRQGANRIDAKFVDRALRRFAPAVFRAIDVPQGRSSRPRFPQCRRAIIQRNWGS